MRYIRVPIASYACDVCADAAEKGSPAWRWIKLEVYYIVCSCGSAVALTPIRCLLEFCETGRRELDERSYDAAERHYRLALLEYEMLSRPEHGQKAFSEFLSVRFDLRENNALFCVSSRALLSISPKQAGRRNQIISRIPHHL